MNPELEALSYPIGRWESPVDRSPEACVSWIGDIERLPELLRAAVEGLSDERLDTPYRHGGWTVRQVVHHVADSHINSYVRFRLAMTEENSERWVTAMLTPSTTTSMIRQPWPSRSMRQGSRIPPSHTGRTTHTGL